MHIKSIFKGKLNIASKITAEKERLSEKKKKTPSQIYVGFYYFYGNKRENGYYEKKKF